MIIKKIQKQIKLSKNNNPFANILVYFEEYKDGKGNMRPISGFGNKRSWAWKVGDDVQPEITEKDGKYLNFSFDDTEENRLNVYALPATIGFVMDLLKDKPVKPSQEAEGATDNGDVKPEDIPF